MNENFSLILQQCITEVDKSESYCLEHGLEDNTTHKIDVAKFAELIVFECTKVIVFGGYRNPALGEKHPLTPPEIATMIKEHFGVEE